MRKKAAKAPGRPRKATNAFGRWIGQDRCSRDDITERLEISRAHLDRLCRNNRRPDLELDVRIEDLTKGAVAIRSWLNVPKHSEK